MNKTELFIKKAIKIHGDKYNYNKVNYVRAIDKVIIICKDHGDFLQSPNIHLSGKGCKKCGDLQTGSKLKSNTNDFIKKANIIHNNTYDYSLVTYCGNKNKINIICQIHGIFKQIAQNHLKGCGCSKCGFIISANAKYLNTEDFIKKAIKTHGFIYSYEKVNWIGCNKKIIIICNKHGDFKQIPSNHLSGQGCPKCANNQFSKSQIQWLEFLEKYYNINIQHAMNKGEFKIPSTRYLADGYCKETNTIFEYNGDYFHGNPKLFKSKEINKLCKITHGELYERTINRENKIKELGYNLVVMWESDWNNINKYISILQKKFKSCKRSNLLV